MNGLKDIKEPRKQGSWVTWSKIKKKTPPSKNTSQNVTEKELTTGKEQEFLFLSEIVTISQVVTSKG